VNLEEIKELEGKRITSSSAISKKRKKLEVI
jgi:hypothetical protein